MLAQGGKYNHSAPRLSHSQASTSWVGNLMEGKNGAFMAVSHNDNDFVGMLHGMFELPCLLSVLHLAAKSDILNFILPIEHVQ